MKNKHDTQLRTETDELKKDKKETVDGLTNHFKQEHEQMKEDHALQLK